MILANVPAGTYLVGAYDGRRAVGRTLCRLKGFGGSSLWNNGSADRPVPPFRLPLIRLDETDSHVMLEVLEKRLAGRI
jgi:hypothetical protein